MANTASHAAGNISLAIVQDATLGNEGYKLLVTPQDCFFICE